MTALQHKGTGHSKHRSVAGTAAIEFGLAIPLLLIMLMGVAELGFAMYGAMQVYNSVEAGALYAARNGYSTPASPRRGGDRDGNARRHRDL